jgi:nucleoside-diphosphate-sugar epimerase
VKAAVTGGTGFVGSHLIEELRRQDIGSLALVRRTSNVSRLTSLGVDWVIAPFDDRGAVEQAVAGADVVLHLAALTRAPSEAELERVNVEATRLLLQAVLDARPRVRRFVYMSSLAAAGPARNGRALEPSDEPQPLSAYGRSKLAAEGVVLAAAGELEVIVVRAPAVYGPRDRDLLTFFRFAAHGMMPIPAGAGRALQLVHARDLARALVMAATEPGAAGVYHVADPTPYAWEEIVELVASAVGRRARPVHVPETLVRVAASLAGWAGGMVGRTPAFNRDKAEELLARAWLCDTSRARGELGWRSEIELASGLDETARWYREHGWL